MKDKIKLDVTHREIRLPVHYNYFIQAAVYNLLSGEFAEFLHDRGYEGGGRRFKLFVFSRFTGEYRLLGQDIIFGSKLKLIICSPIDRFCQDLLNGLLTKGELRIGQAILPVESVKAEAPQIKGNFLKLRLLSPVVAYSTLLKADGSKYTCYYQPEEREFERVSGENLRKKFWAIRRDCDQSFKTTEAACDGV